MRAAVPAVLALLCACSGAREATPEPADAGANAETEAAPPCSSSTPDGECPPDHRCMNGACELIEECARDPGEPNDSRGRATSLPLETELSGNACSNDADWFRVEVPAGQLVSVIATVGRPRTAANLDAYAYATDGTLLGGLWQGKEPHPTFTLANETTEESFGFYGAASGATYFIKIVPRAPANAGPYRIIAHATEWKDGASCTGEGYTLAECTGGAKGAQTLWMFPYLGPDDTYAGAGWLFDEFSSYRWLRRETMMLIRYAVHEVSRQFPGTKPLGFADMCQRNGITPGYDVKKARHPETSHDQGGNIDVAYYSTLADNHVRVVCDDKGGSQTPDSWYCLDSAVTTHVVDLPRTVYFVVALARNPRFRAAGVDRVLAPLMQAEAVRLRDAGTITASEYDAYVKHVVWGDAWPAHHHHLHLSMAWL